MNQHDIEPDQNGDRPDPNPDASVDPGAEETAAEAGVDESALPPETQTEPAPETEAQSSSSGAPTAQLQQLLEERDLLKDQLLRARAEFENFRKRKAREAEEMRKRASEDLIRDLLPVVDHMEMALSHVEDTKSGLAQGVEMVLKQFAGILSARGLSPIATVGENFDPNVHEALTQQPSAEHAEGVVVSEYQRGYRLGDFVLRPAKVVVSAGPPNEGGTPGEETDKQA